MKMRLAIAMVTVASVLIGCVRETAPEVNEVVMSPAEVGSKTADYEVVSATQLKLAPGVRAEIVKDAKGQSNGFVLMRRNNGVGGYMACGCVGATTSTCRTENDNPEHPSCSGSCTDSEGNGHPCQLEGPLIGPPKDPFTLKFVARSDRQASRQ
jgi:hypothetical protein